ncbi:cilia- and flagella-associated protein 61-like [Episyrphus balteatus]|uniref:cilia- and flagella-associated protein 61-like n=1 Tax=Episyrphus balteatus TaxID=286459 RepID=UPI002486A437|nr:cilia- and flagella-associated protein 61-like [Episyrphus balteatus]
MSRIRKKSTTCFINPKTKVRDATFEDLKVIRTCIKNSTLKFFGDLDLKLEFRDSIYSLVVEQESGKMSAYVNIANSPNVSALPKGCWLEWIQFHFKLTQITYGNTLFLTYLVVDDPYNNSILKDIYEEMFLREPKIKFICTVAPPIDSIYEDILAVHSKQIFSLDKSINRLSQSIFVCERYNIIPRMRLRRALVEDNDDLVEIIDQKLKGVRLELGEYYIAEQVIRNDPEEAIIVAEILNNTVGMMWLNTRVNQKVLGENFETTIFGNFIKKSQNQHTDTIKTKSVIDLIRKRSDIFFDSIYDDRKTKQNINSPKEPLSLNNMYINTSSNDSNDDSNEFEEEYPRNLFRKWNQINTNLRSPYTYVEETKKYIKAPQKSDLGNVFAIQLFGLSSTIDPRRIYDLIGSSFSAYPDKDYCIISLPSTEASSNSLNGFLLEYFSRAIPRVGCKISDCLYVAHRNSFLTEIELSELTRQDIADVESILCYSAFKGSRIYNVADIMQSIEEYLTNQWSTFNVLTIRCGGCVIGFVVLRTNCLMNEFRRNYVLHNDDDLYPEWQSGELKYLHLHPAFIWEWVHVTREIFRLTGCCSIFYKLRQESNKPILNSILLNMFPLLPRRRIYDAFIDPYALYYINIKMCHMARTQVENKIVIVGFNETCKGFLKTLFFSQSCQRIQCLNITVITECNGFIEAEHDKRSFEEQKSMFFQANDKFSADFLRKLEFRTWVSFIGGELEEINWDNKRLILKNGTEVPYDQLFLMSSSVYSSPKSFKTAPLNYIEINNRLEKIIFYHKIQQLKKNSIELPLLIYGSVVMAHSCVGTLIDLGIKPSNILLVIPTNEIDDFPATLDDDYVTNWIYKKETEVGVKIYQNLKFLDWNLYPNEEEIESVVFESNSGKIFLKCLAFISFHIRNFPQSLRETLMESQIEILNNRIVVDEKSKTNIPFVYACGRITQYQESLLANQSQQEFLNQSEVGNQLALNFMEEKLETGSELNMIEVNFVKPIFRQFQLLNGWVYGGLRKPGRYISRQYRMDHQLLELGQDITSSSKQGEYCRLNLDQNGIIFEITCLTRKNIRLT